MASAWVGDKARTIVPPTAKAELDIRLVPETDGDRLKGLIKNHLEQLGFYLSDKVPSKKDRLAHDHIMNVTETDVMDAFRTDMNNPYGQFLVTALQKSFGENVVKIRTMGGTVPIATFVKALKIPAFIVPLVNPDNNQHSPNENLKIGQIGYGIRVFYGVLSTKN